MDSSPAAALLMLFAPGAGAPSSSAWMTAWKTRLEALGGVRCLDYPYQLVGRRSPDRPAVLVAAHRAALAEASASHVGPVVLVGKSMGGRIGCHVAAALAGESLTPPAALVCLGYPLVGQRGAVRDEVLLALRTPVLFVQGSRDPLCPLDRLQEVRQRMQAPNELHVVQGGDHSLNVGKAALRAAGLTQDAVDGQTLAAMVGFLGRHLSPAR